MTNNGQTPGGNTTTAGAVEGLAMASPCHFCSSETRVATLHAARISWAQVECSNDDCSATGPCADTEADAIVKWTLPNERAAIVAHLRWLRDCATSVPDALDPAAAGILRKLADSIETGEHLEGDKK